MTSAVPDARAPATLAIDVRGLRHTYRNGHTALDFAQNPAVIAALRAAGAVCGGDSVFTDGRCQPGPQAAATGEGYHFVYRELAPATAKMLEQSEEPDSLVTPGLD